MKRVCVPIALQLLQHTRDRICICHTECERCL